MIRIKNINLILLSILLNNNLNSMQSSDKEESKSVELSNLTQKTRANVIYKLIEHYIDKIKNIDNIFKLYFIYFVKNYFFDLFLL